MDINMSWSIIDLFYDDDDDNFKIIMVNNIWFKINNAQSLTFFNM